MLVRRNALFSNLKYGKIIIISIYLQCKKERPLTNNWSNWCKRSEVRKSMAYNTQHPWSVTYEYCQYSCLWLSVHTMFHLMIMISSHECEHCSSHFHATSRLHDMITAMNNTKSTPHFRLLLAKFSRHRVLLCCSTRVAWSLIYNGLIFHRWRITK